MNTTSMDGSYEMDRSWCLSCQWRGMILYSGSLLVDQQALGEKKIAIAKKGLLR